MNQNADLSVFPDDVMKEWAKNIQEIVEQDKCWNCGVKGSIHHHHVVPRHCGGTNGPTVPLCSNCHTLVHHVGEDFHGRVGELRSRREAYLANVIHMAQKVTEDDPNKVTRFNLTLSRRHREMLKVLKATLGERSIENTMKRLVEDAHSRLTGHS